MKIGRDGKGFQIYNRKYLKNDITVDDNTLIFKIFMVINLFIILKIYAIYVKYKKEKFF